MPPKYFLHKEISSLTLITGPGTYKIMSLHDITAEDFILGKPGNGEYELWLSATSQKCLPLLKGRLEIGYNYINDEYSVIKFDEIKNYFLKAQVIDKGKASLPKKGELLEVTVVNKTTENIPLGYFFNAVKVNQIIASEKAVRHSQAQKKDDLLIPEKNTNSSAPNLEGGTYVLQGSWIFFLILLLGGLYVISITTGGSDDTYINRVGDQEMPSMLGAWLMIGYIFLMIKIFFKKESK